MKEEEVSQKLMSYSAGLGSCERVAPQARRNPGRRWAVLAVVPAVLAFGLVGVLVGPRVAAAATLRRFQAAITNAESMDARWSFQDQSGTWFPVGRRSYELGEWRMDFSAPNHWHEATFIFRDGLCYSDFKALPDVTVQPANEVDLRPTEGEALEVVKDQFKRFAYGSSLSVERSPDVNGRGTYRVVLNRADPNRPQIVRRVEIVVDRETNLPIYADTFGQFGAKQQRSHCDYVFNVKFPKGFFDPNPDRPLIDLRKTVPAFEAAHKPIADFEGLQVVDACVSPDGTIWLMTRGDGAIDPGTSDPVPGVRYATGIQIVAGQGPGHELFLHVMAPVDPVPATPGQCTVVLHRHSVPPPVHSDSDTRPAIADLGAVKTLTLPLKRIRTAMPAYIDNLGFGEQLLSLPWDIVTQKAYVLTDSGRPDEAAKLFEQFGREARKYSGEYDDGMSTAAEYYRKAGMSAEADRIDAELAAERKFMPAP